MKASSIHSKAQQRTNSFEDTGSVNTNNEDGSPDPDYEVIGDNFSETEVSENSYISKASEQKALKLEKMGGAKLNEKTGPRKPSTQTKIFTFFTIIR